MKVILFAIMIAFSADLFAQDKPSIITDRPDQTESPVVVPTNSLQVETGFQLQQDNNGEIRTSEYTYNTTLIRYGVNENFELRLVNEYVGNSIRTSSESIQANGFSPLALGVKIRLSDADGLIPDASLIGHINPASGSGVFRASHASADFRFTFAHNLNDRLALSYNIGASWKSESPAATFLYTLSISGELTDHLAVFLESYGFFPEASKADHRLDTGIVFLISPVAQWDFSGGLGLSENAPDCFVSSGLSFRLGR